MESGFQATDILQLQEILAEGDPDIQNRLIAGNQGPQSVLNPGDINKPKNANKKVAKPYAKIEAKINNRNSKIGASKEENVIWEGEDVKEEPKRDKKENRKRPEFDVIYKQNVRTEDVYLGMSGLNPGSGDCQIIKIKIQLPGTKLPEIQCDITPKCLTLQTPVFYLQHYFANEVKDKDANAKWVSDIEELHLDIPVVKKDFPF